MVKRNLIALFAAVFATFVSVHNAQTPTLVSFGTDDGGTIYANEYGTGRKGVVLVHGGRFNKESWSKQAIVLVEKGFRVLAIDLRGYGKSAGPGQGDVFTAPLYLDVLGAVRYLRANGSNSVSVIGGSLGGGAAADAVGLAKRGEVKRLVTLGSPAGQYPPEKINVPLLVITTRNDANAEGLRLPGIQAAYDKVPGKKKELVILEGTAHAQFMFDTDQGEKVMDLILTFLSAK